MLREELNGTSGGKLGTTENTLGATGTPHPESCPRGPAHEPLCRTWPVLPPRGGGPRKERRVAVWDRPESAQALPAVVTVEWLRGLDSVEFTDVLRDNLLPRPGDGAGRRSWQTLWRLLADWPDLQKRAQEALSGLLEAVEAHLSANPGDSQAATFREHCQQRWNKLDPSRLRRGGQNSSRGEQLLAAIALHRRVTIDSGQDVRAADVALWACLDPDRGPR